MDLKGKDILTAAQFSREDIEHLFAIADDFSARLQKGERLRRLDGKLLATVFYEPSTRTRLSFESAMQRLGGGVVSVAEAKTASSVAKGETLADTVRTIENYADAIVLRHSEVGAAQAAADAASVPILNAGDGAGEHPTQALLDLYTIRAQKGRIDGLRVALVGDLKNGRTVHSLARALSQFKVDFSFVAPAALAMPAEVSDYMRARDFAVEETNDLARTLTKADVVYMTRVQKERFADPKQYDKLKNFYILNRDLVSRAKDNLLVMHPLPRVDEITTDVDSLPNAAYFRQARNGVFIRMALLAEILGG
ncbi:MAG: aspartate carbamoyltransferase [Chloroflexi bacterium]|nr:aspartate carbamoyltransferase [Chloroflexota bacterium]